MPNPRIIWNGNNLDLPEPPSDFVARPRAKRSLNMSSGKVHSVTLESLAWEGNLLLSRFPPAYRDFEAFVNEWYSWAVQGNQYALTRDSALVYSAAITAQVNAAVTVIVVASTTGLNIGDWIILQHATSPLYHKALISGLTGTVITCTGYPAKFIYPVGSIVRHEHYFPKVICLDDELPVREELGPVWTFDHHWREDAA